MDIVLDDKKRRMGGNNKEVMHFKALMNTQEVRETKRAERGELIGRDEAFTLRELKIGHNLTLERELD